MEIADSVRSGTTFSESVRIRTGEAGGRDCGRLAGSANCGIETSFFVSGKAILLVAFILTPETPRRTCANPPQEIHSRMAQNSQGKRTERKDAIADGLASICGKRVRCPIFN